MIKFSTQENGTRIIGLGITQGTYSQMLHGQVMQVDLTQLGIPGHKLLILAGKDELSITRDLQEHIGEATKMHVDPAAILRGAKG
jgi:hypothetical protein